MSTANKLTYLNETKQELKEAINNVGGEITDETTFREYVDELNDVYNNYPKTQYGEETDVVLNDCNKGKLEIIEKGNSTQVSTTGKNLFPVTNQDFTINKLRFYSNNGSLTLDGTTSAIIYSNDQNLKDNLKLTLSAGTYIISHKTGVMQVFLFNYNTGSQIVSVSTNVSSNTFTLNQETEVYIGFYVSSGIAFYDVDLEIMIRLSSIADSTFEPYTRKFTFTKPKFPSKYKGCNWK